MRLIVFGLVFMFAAVPAAQAQQALAPAQHQQALVAASTQPSDFRPVDAPIGVTMAQVAPPSVETIQARNAAAEHAAYQDPSARNILAIVGAVVVVVALIVFLSN